MPIGPCGSLYLPRLKANDAQTQESIVDASVGYGRCTSNANADEVERIISAYAGLHGSSHSSLWLRAYAQGKTMSTQSCGKVILSSEQSAALYAKLADRVPKSSSQVQDFGFIAAL